jgi:hypothetical protein
MTALELIHYLGVIPMSAEKPTTRPSNGELKRWLDQGSVLINGKKHSAKEEVVFPIEHLVFFPKSPRRTTVI